MSDVKRAALLPLTTPLDTKKKAPATKEAPKTVRLSVVLPQPTEDTCPEYNYKDQLEATKKPEKRVVSEANGFQDDDDDVRRIAQQMEEKYGGITTAKTKKRARKDEYADIGMGYDESDSFIDNTDGYDEMIPQNVTTLHGGFYINCGALEFKTIDLSDYSSNSSSSSEEDQEDSNKKAPSRKRIIESSDETDRETKTEKGKTPPIKKPKVQNGVNGLQPSLKKKLLAQNKVYVKKRRIIEPPPPPGKTVKELLREKREDLDMSIPQDLDKDGDNEPKKMKTITNVNDIIESVVKASIGENKPVKNHTKPPLKPSANGTEHKKPSESAESSHKSKSSSKNYVKLPEQLPEDILILITSIVSIAEKSSDVKNHFTSEVNLLLLRLDAKCKCLGKPSKMKVQEHLATALNCSADTLVKHINVLVLEENLKKLKKLLTSLNAEINKVMPGLLDNYEKECQKIKQKRIEHPEGEETNKSLRMPKRHFQWSDFTKKCVKDIVILKKRCFLLQGKSNEESEVLMASFLKSDLQPLWPEGWLSTSALNKIYTSYAGWTSNNAPKPPLPVAFTNNSSLSIIPVAAPKTDLSLKPTHNSVASSSSAKPCTETSINLTMKSLPAENTCDIVKATEKLKDYPQLEITRTTVNQHSAKKPETIVSGSEVKHAVSVKEKHPTKDESFFQVIDLSDKSESKSKNDSGKSHQHHHHQQHHYHQQQKPQQQQHKPQQQQQKPQQQQQKAQQPQQKPQQQPQQKPQPQQQKTQQQQPQKHHHHHHQKDKVQNMHPSKHQNQHHDINFLTKNDPTKTWSGNELEKVMEDLKVLQKMSSPKKVVDTTTTPTSSPVSVIAVNKSFPATKKEPSHSPQPAHTQSSTMQRYDYKSDFSTGFQNEFQKQFLTAFMTTTTASPSKNYNRYPHISGSSSTITSDKYYQSANNNYAQNPNGHKTSPATSNSQSAGTYNILDDMFANLFTHQYGYSKEATTPKSSSSQQK